MLKKERISSGGDNSDWFLCKVRTSEEAAEIRKKIMEHKLRSTVFVFIKKKGFDIFLSNEFGGMPTDEHYKTIKELINIDENDVDEDDAN